MRRISLALALIGAIAATGCGQSGSDDGTGGNPGIKEGTFTIVVQNGQAMVTGQPENPSLRIVGGRVTSTSTPALNCGGETNVACSITVSNRAPVTLTAVPDSGLALLAWAGDCQGSATSCVLTGPSDKYIVAVFGLPGTVPHPNRTDPAIHGQAYLDFALGAPGAWDCRTCHGAALLGQGIAVSCASCHSWPMGGHFTVTGHNSGSCARCHTSGGFKDFVGADGTASAVATVAYGSAVPAGQSNSGIDATVAFTEQSFQCNTCHNPVTEPIGSAGTWTEQKRFASGNLLTLDASSAICAQCHDGARPGYEVAQLTLQLNGLVTDATPDARLTTYTNGAGVAGQNANTVVRAHYVNAAATFYGEEAGGYYEYTNYASTRKKMNYTGRNQHGGLGKCTSCHNAHTGELPADLDIAARCGDCHFDELTGLPVQNFMQLEESRQYGFEGDIDGDAIPEPLKAELAGMGAALRVAIEAYAANVAGTAICAYNNRFYVRSSETVACGTTPNNAAYNAFTPALLRAGFNYLMWENDTGAWAHNPRYVIEILYDAIWDLNRGLLAAGRSPVSTGVKRAFRGHFGGSEDPSPYAALTYHGSVDQNSSNTPWASFDGFTSGACYQCHGGEAGLQAYLTAMPAALTNTVITPASKVTAFECTVCHENVGPGERFDDIRVPATVYFPPQKNSAGDAGQVQFAAADMPRYFALCATCHSGRENMASITKKIGTRTDTDFVLSVTNPHYLGSAALIMGTDAKAIYEYPGRTYAGRGPFWTANTNGDAPGPHGSPHGAACVGCHLPKGTAHTFEVDIDRDVVPGQTQTCAQCHRITPYGDFRLPEDEVNVDRLAAALLVELQQYATANWTEISADAAALATPVIYGGDSICYNSASHPYFFVENAGACTSQQFVTFNPKMLKAAFNFLWAKKSMGAGAHNYAYMAQGLIDAIQDLDPAATLPLNAKTGAPIVRP